MHLRKLLRAVVHPCLLNLVMPLFLHKVSMDIALLLNMITLQLSVHPSMWTLPILGSILLASLICSIGFITMQQTDGLLLFPFVPTRTALVVMEKLPMFHSTFLRVIREI